MKDEQPARVLKLQWWVASGLHEKLIFFCGAVNLIA